MDTAERIPLTDLDELLHRQVHPRAWKVVEDRPASSAFAPTPKDHGQLSVHRGSKVTAQEAYARFTARGLSSAGTWSVSAGECVSEGLTPFDDPLPDDDAHALVAFGQRPRKDIEAIAKRLLRFALARGCYRPEVTT